MIPVLTRHNEAAAPTGVDVQPDRVFLAHSSQLINLVKGAHDGAARGGVHEERCLALILARFDPAAGTKLHVVLKFILYVPRY